MGDARRAVAMLLAPDQQEARYTAEVVDQMNQQRRGSDQHTTQEALDMIAGSPTLQNAHATVLYKADWHQGVLGIVASRCLDQYYRPTVILTQRDGKATGSARSVAGFDVHAGPGVLRRPARPVRRAPRRRRPHPEGGKRARLPAPASSRWWPTP